MARKKQPSRGDRWHDAAGRALAALNDLIEVQEEYQEWRDNLPENLQGSALGEKLNDVADMDLESARDTVEEAEAADLPLGFGRD